MPTKWRHQIARTRPMRPESTIAFICRITGMWRMLWPTNRRVRFSIARASIASVSSTRIAIGFSLKVGMPAASVFSATSAWAKSGARIMTASTSCSASSWSTSSTVATSSPNSSRALSLLRGVGSATTVTRDPSPGWWAWAAR